MAKTKKIVRVKRLTLKQRKFLVLYFKYGNAAKAAMEAYDCGSYASATNIGSHCLQRLKAPVKAYLEKNKLDLGQLLKVLKKGLKATKTISAISGKQASGETTDFIEVPDYATRHKYLETAAKWLGVSKEAGEEEGEKAVVIKLIKEFVPKDRVKRLKEEGVEVVDGETA